MSNFTPQQIEEFLQEFFDVVGARQYVGARYVPIFGRAGEDTIEWDDLAPYEPLTVVMHQGVSYVSRRYVPTGIPLTSTEYWVETYRFNAQVEQYRQQVLRVSAQIDQLRADVESEYVPFPDSSQHSKYGREGQVLTTLTNGETMWDDPVQVTSDVAEPLIDAWLDAHPEATTTVQDNTISTAKLVDGAVTTAKLANGSVTEAKLADDSVTDVKLWSRGVRLAANAGQALEIEGLTYSVGYINTSGTIADNDQYRYLDQYIEVWKGETVRFACGKANPGNGWLKLGVYGVNGNFVTRVDVPTTGDSRFYEAEWTNNYTLTTAPYLVRPTFIVSTQGDDWSFSVSRLPGVDRLRDDLEAFEASTRLDSRGQEVIDLPTNYTYIATALDGTVLTLNPANNVTYSAHLIDCTAGDRFTISGTGGTSMTARLWVFIDANNRVLSGASANVTVYDDVIEAPAGATRLLVNFNLINPDHALVRGYSGPVILPGTMTSSADAADHYIAVGDDVSTLDTTPTYFRGYTWAIVPCSAGETFTVYARSGISGRAWAFANQSGTIIERARAGTTCNGEVIVAPPYAATLVLNSEANQFACYRGGRGALGESVRTAAIPDVQICDMPKDVVAMPTVENLSQVEETLGTAVAKTAIYKNGDWFCVTYGQNVDGTGTDIPLIGGSGCLEMVYKRFRLDNGTVSDVQYGRIARIGDTYTDHEGNTATMTGGCGLPSGIGNLQYFTTPYTVTDGDKSYEFSGIANYGFTPCCCTVEVASDGTVTIGAIQELVLVVGGVSGKFDLHRIDPDYQNAYTYVTTAPPAKMGTTWYWAQVVRNGVAILTSTDGITWTHAATLRTPYQPRCEVVISAVSNRLLLGVRTSVNSPRETNALYLMLVDVSRYRPLSEYRIPFVESRTQIVPTGDEWLLFNPTNDKAVVEVIRITRYTDMLRFWRWFTIYVKPTWYVTCYQPSVASADFADMYLAGGNSSAGSTAGLSFMHLSFDPSEPHSPLAIPASVG